MSWLHAFFVGGAIVCVLCLLALPYAHMAGQLREAIDRVVKKNNQIAVLNKRLDEVLLFDNNHEAVETLARAIARTVGYDPDATERTLHVGLGHSKVVGGENPLWKCYIQDAEELLKALREGKTGG